jgi:dCMP deaminase
MDWDTYFLNIACETAKRTKCMSRPIGTVLVARRKFVVGTGFNGPPIGVLPCSDKSVWRDRGLDAATLEKFPALIDQCPRRLLGYKSGEGTWLCPAAHSERNAIDIAARMGMSTERCSLYLTCGVPCLECAKTIIQAGIVEVVVTRMTVYEPQPITGLQMLQEGGVRVRLYHCDAEAILKEKGMP